MCACACETRSRDTLGRAKVAPQGRMVADFGLRGSHGQNPLSWEFSRGAQISSEPPGLIQRTHTGGVVMALTAGQAAPDFTPKDQSQKEIKLSDFRGKNVVLVFYPLDW